MATISSEELQDAWDKVKAMTLLPEPPEPKLPALTPKMPMKSKLSAVQNVINSLEYNYTGTLYFDVNKNRSFKSIANTAKEILKDALPIQCLEAVFLGAYLTAGFPNLDRFPISFKTTAGLSRCDKLMNKDLKFDSLSDLVLNYCNEFQKVYHTVVKVNVGFPMSHDIHSSERVEWRVLNLCVDTNAWVEVAKQLDNFGKDAAEIETFKKAKGEFPAWFGTKYALNTPELELTGSPRTRARSSFSEDYDDFEEEPPEPAPVVIAIPPIIVTPDEFLFKKPSSNAIAAPPTNVFLQNTTTSPYLIEIEDMSGLLEIVTKTQPTLQAKPPQSESSHQKAVSSFHISAKGMIAVAIKYNFDVTAETNEPPHQMVSFRCKPMARSSDNLDDVLPDAKTYTHATPFVLKDM